MAFRPDAHRQLLRYAHDAAAKADPHKLTITGAVVLTDGQHAAILKILRDFWSQGEYTFPKSLDVKPRHGFRSRVRKDGFSPDQYVEWLVAGCSDIADVRTDERGRPSLIVSHVQDENRIVYDLLVPIRSAQRGYVHIDDVIPKGLPPKKKQPPRQSR